MHFHFDPGNFEKPVIQVSPALFWDLLSCNSKLPSDSFCLTHSRKVKSISESSWEFWFWASWQMFQAIVENKHTHWPVLVKVLWIVAHLEKAYTLRANQYSQQAWEMFGIHEREVFLRNTPLGRPPAQQEGDTHREGWLAMKRHTCRTVFQGSLNNSFVSWSMKFN